MRIKLLFSFIEKSCIYPANECIIIPISRGGATMDKVLITGANRGLGYELLKVYSAQQNIIFPLVRSEEAAGILAKEFNNCYPIVADLSTDDSINEIISVISKYADNLDILINNAGISGREYLIETVITEEVSNLFNIHCLGPIRAVKVCLPYMRK